LILIEIWIPDYKMLKRNSARESTYSEILLWLWK